MRLIGLNDSVSPAEVQDVIASAGGCLPADVRVSAIRSLSKGLHTVWAQCPLAAAIQAAKVGKLKIGWTVARILNQRPAQCFRCWATGHLRSQCTAEKDRSNQCFRCGEEGHTAIHCTRPLRCALCGEQGLETTHRVGSAQCRAQFPVLERKSRGGKNVTDQKGASEVAPMETDDGV